MSKKAKKRKNDKRKGRGDFERVSMVPSKPNKNVYKLVAISAEEKTLKGVTSSTFKNRLVAYFGHKASLDLMKPLLATVRARYLFDRWQDKPSDKRRNKAARAYLKAKKLLGKRLQGHTPVTGTYEWSVVQLCLDTLGPIGSSLIAIVKVTGPGEAGTADYSQQVPPRPLVPPVLQGTTGALPFPDGLPLQGTTGAGSADAPSNSSTTASVDGAEGQIEQGGSTR